MTAKKRIVIIDDEVHVRHILKLVISSLPEFEFVGEASNGEEGLTLLVNLKPDVALLDINMPKMDGMEVLRQKKAMNITVPVIMLTSLSDAETVRRCIMNGAINYLLKSNSPEKIREMLGSLAASLSTGGTGA